MANKYIKPNWHSINKAIEADELKELRQEQKSIEKKIQDKIDLHYKEKRIAEAVAKVNALKALPADAIVYYIGRSKDIPFCAEGRKVFVVRNGIKRMQVDFGGKIWNCYYTNLQIEPPNSQEKNSRVITERLTEFINNHTTGL